MKNFIVVIISLFVAFLLTLLPLPIWANIVRPEWICLVIIFWILMFPNRVSVGFAFMVGIVLDLVSGSVLGAHALALVCVAFIVAKFSHRLQFMKVLQQSLVVFLIILIYQAVIFWVMNMTGVESAVLVYWLPSVTSAIFWPWIYYLLRDSIVIRE